MKPVAIGNREIGRVLIPFKNGARVKLNWNYHEQKHLCLNPLQKRGTRETICKAAVMENTYVLIPFKNGARVKLERLAEHGDGIGLNPLQKRGTRETLQRWKLK